jgi:hypothetical protein
VRSLQRTFKRASVERASAGVEGVGVGSVTSSGSVGLELTREVSVCGLNKGPPQGLGSSGSGKHQPDGEEGLEDEVEGWEWIVRRSIKRNHNGFTHGRSTE